MKELNQTQWNQIFKARDAFSVTFFSRNLYGYQKRFSNLVIKAVITNEGGDHVAEFCRQSGKTEIVCITVCFLLLFYYPICRRYGLYESEMFNIGIFAPQKEQAHTDYERIQEYLKKCANKGFDFEFDTFNGQEIHLSSNKYPPRRVFCFTASVTSHSESKTLNVIILEESQDLIDFKINKTILPMGTQTNSVNIWIGTAGYRKCEFFNRIEKLPSEKKVIISSYEAIEERRKMYDKTQDLVHLNYEKVVDRYDQASNEFKTQYLLVWILELGQFITFDQLNKLIDIECGVIYDKYPKTRRVKCGIDWGKAADSTIVTFIDMGTGAVIEWLEYQNDDYATQAMDIAQRIYERYKDAIENIHCDSTASQDQQVDNLRARLEDYRIYAPVIGVPFTSSNKDKMYKNLYRLMTDRVQNKVVVEPAFLKFGEHLDPIKKEKFIKQMLDLQKEIRNNQWKCHHPDGSGYHDDFSDSVALACYDVEVKRKNSTWNYAIG